MRVSLRRDSKQRERGFVGPDIIDLMRKEAPVQNQA
jgi:hypothetical protein